MAVAFAVVMSLIVLGMNWAVDRWRASHPEPTPVEIESPSFPVSQGRIEMGCADHSKDIRACIELNVAALPQASRLWAAASREQRLACYDRRIGHVNQALRIRECLVSLGVVAG